MNIIRHAPQDGVGHRFGGVAARRLIAMNLLNRFEIDDRHDSDFQIAVLGDIDFVSDDGAVQAFVKEKVRTWLKLLPRCEGPGQAAVLLKLEQVMNVGARAPAASLRIGAECRLELLEQIGVVAEVTVMVVAVCRRLQHPLLHIGAVPAVERVAFDINRTDLLAAEDLLESSLDRGRPGAGRAGDSDDGMLDRHRVKSPRSENYRRRSPRFAKSGTS